MSKNRSLIISNIITGLVLTIIFLITKLSNETLVLNYIVFSMGVLSTALAIFALYFAFNEKGESQEFNKMLEKNLENLKAELKELDKNTKEIESITTRIDSQNFSKAEDLMQEFIKYYKEKKEGETKISAKEVENLTDDFLDFYKGYNIFPSNNSNGSSQVRQFIYNKYNKNDYINRQDIIKAFENNNDVTEGMISGVIHKLINSDDLESDGRGKYKKLV